MEEQQGQQPAPEFNKDAVKSLLTALEKNRRIPSGARNFQAQPPTTLNKGNPYPEQQPNLAGRMMEQYMGQGNEPQR